MLGLYIHVPFCSAICNYCNSNRGLLDAALKLGYVDALIEQIRQDQRAAANTVYFGGGTPSLIEPQEIERILRACADSFDLAAECEVTLEANPESVTGERLASFRASGVNRVSFGVQSCREDDLVRLSRLHKAGRARAAVAEARAAGFDNISLDLMMWLPGQELTA